MKVPHSVHREGSKGSQHISREGFRFHVICCLVVLGFCANLGEGPYIVVFDAINCHKLAFVLKSAFNPRLV